MTSVEPTNDGHSPAPEEAAELARCLAAYDRDPDAGETWEAIRDEALREIGEGALDTTP